MDDAGGNRKLDEADAAVSGSGEGHASSAPSPGGDDAARAAADAARPAEEARIGDFVALVRASFWEIDATFRLTRFATSLGHFADGDDVSRRARLIGKTPWEIAGADPGIDDNWKSLRETLIAHLPFHDFRFASAGADGQVRHVSSSGTPLFDGKGAFTGYRGVTIDETAVVESERKRRDAEALLRDAIESISEGFVIFDAEDRLVMYNTSFRDMLYPLALADGGVGISYEELLRRGIACGEYPVEAWGREEEWVQERIAQHHTPGGVVEHHDRYGRWLLLTERRMKNGGIAGLRMDITARKRAEEALRRSEERYALALEGSNDSLWDWDVRRGTIYSSRHAQEALGLGSLPVEWQAHDFYSEMHPGDASRFRSELIRYLRGQTPLFECEIRMRRADGGYRWAVLRGKGLRDAEGRVYRMAGSARDITAQKEAEAKVNFLAYHDPVTGLANQALLNIQVKQATAVHSGSRRDGVLLVVEITNFRDIVTGAGVTASDALLVEVAERLKVAVRPQDLVARCGTNLFSVLARGTNHPDGAVSLVHRLLALFQRPFMVDGASLYLTPSIGIAAFPANGTEPDTLFRNAMMALGSVPPMERPRYRFYSDDLAHAALKRLTLQQQLRHAIDHGDLDVFYEPLVDIKHRNRIIGVEALVRWNHPERGLLCPDEFIPIAEQSGLIGPLGEWVLRQACTQLCTWQTAENLTFPISVNVSREQLRGGDFAHTVLSVLKETGLSPTDLVLELTESSVLQDVDKVRMLMNDLTRVGVRFAIDDFGVEHSALSHLVQLPVSTIKIDRIFVSQVTKDDRFAAIVQAIVSMAKVMNKKTTAEGVETQDQLVFLHASGSDFAQGRLFSQALPAAEFTDYLRHYPTH